jgi:hypothetical protein
MSSQVVRLAGQVTRSGLHTPSGYLRGSTITAQPEMIQDKCHGSPTGNLLLNSQRWASRTEQPEGVGIGGADRCPASYRRIRWDACYLTPTMTP